MNHYLNHMKQSIRFMILLALTSCATNSGGYKKSSDVEKRLFSMTAEQVMIDLGKPRYITEIGEYSKVWKYYDQPDGLSGGSCEITLIVEAGTIVKADVVSEGKASIFYPLEPCRNLLANLRKPEPMQEQDKAE